MHKSEPPSISGVIGSLENVLLREEEKRSHLHKEHLNALSAARALISRKKPQIAEIKERLEKEDTRWKSAFLVAAKYVEVAQRQGMILSQDLGTRSSNVSETKKLEQKLLEKECKEVAIELLLDDCEYQLAQSQAARDSLYQELRQSIYDLSEIEAYRMGSSATLPAPRYVGDPSATASQQGSSIKKEMVLVKGCVTRIQNKLSNPAPDVTVLRAEANALFRQVDELQSVLVETGMFESPELGLERTRQELHRTRHQLSKAEERERVMQIIIEELEQQLTEMIASNQAQKRQNFLNRLDLSDDGMDGKLPSSSSLAAEQQPRKSNGNGKRKNTREISFEDEQPQPTSSLRSVKQNLFTTASSPSSPSRHIEAMIVPITKMAPEGKQLAVRKALHAVLKSQSQMMTLLKLAFTHEASMSNSDETLFAGDSISTKLWSLFCIRLAGPYIRTALTGAFEKGWATLLRSESKAVGEPSVPTAITVTGIFLQSIFDSMDAFPWTLHQILNHILSIINGRFRREGIALVSRLFFANLIRNAVNNPSMYNIPHGVSGENEMNVRELLSMVGMLLHRLVQNVTEYPRLMHDPLVLEFAADNAPIVREFVTEILGRSVMVTAEDEREQASDADMKTLKELIIRL